MRGVSDDVSGPDVQRFDSDGTWIKPPGAVRVDVELKGGNGGTSCAYLDVGHGHGGGAGEDAPVPGHTRAPWLDKPGAEGETVRRSFAAADLPDRVDIEVGKGGRPGGRDGYVLVITDLER